MDDNQLLLKLFLPVNCFVTFILLYFNLTSGSIPRNRGSWFFYGFLVLWFIVSVWAFADILAYSWNMPLKKAALLLTLILIVLGMILAGLLRNQAYLFGFVKQEKLLPNHYSSWRDLRFMARSGQAGEVLHYLKNDTRLHDQADTFEQVDALDRRRKANEEKLKLKEISHEDYYFQQQVIEDKLVDLLSKKK